MGLWRLQYGSLAHERINRPHREPKILAKRRSDVQINPVINSANEIMVDHRYSIHGIPYGKKRVQPPIRPK